MSLFAIDSQIHDYAPLHVAYTCSKAQHFRTVRVSDHFVMSRSVDDGAS